MNHKLFLQAKVKVSKKNEEKYVTAIIRYIGHVHDTQGIWYGVEFFEHCRGKHHEYVYYDRNRKLEIPEGHSFSFVREGNVYPGECIMIVILSKYGYDCTEYEEINISTNKVIECIGFEKTKLIRSNFSKLKYVDISYSNVAFLSLKNSTDFMITFKNLESIDLIDTLLLDFNKAIEIFQHLPSLKTANLNKNPFNWDLVNSIAKINGITTLSIQNTQIKDIHLSLVATTFPNVKILNLSYNKITNIYDLTLSCVYLKELSLVANNIGNWSLLFSNLESFEFIDTIILDENPIYPVKLNDVVIESITTLSIRRTKITSWDEISYITNIMPGLQNFRFSQNFLTKRDENWWDMCLGRMPDLSTLDLSFISAKSLKDAEVFYWNEMKSVYLEAKSNGKLNDFFAVNPNYVKVIAVYGEPVYHFVKPITINQNLLNLTITFNEHTIVKDHISDNMIIKRFKILCKNIFNIGRHKKLRVFVVKPELKELHEIFDDLYELSYYGISSGDKIYIEEM